MACNKVCSLAELTQNTSYTLLLVPKIKKINRCMQMKYNTRTFIKKCNRLRKKYQCTTEFSDKLKYKEARNTTVMAVNKVKNVFSKNL